MRAHLISGHIPYGIYEFIKFQQWKLKKAMAAMQGPLTGVIDKKEQIDIFSKSGHVSGVAHIIGSGGSLNISSQMIDSSRDAILGCNLAALIDLPFSYYTIEFAGPNVKNISDVQIELSLKVLNNRPGSIVVLKNIMAPKNDLRYIQNNVPKEIRKSFDYTFPCRVPSDMICIAERIFDPQGRNIVLQYCSSIVNLVAIAHAGGCKDIVLHGVDFGGLYFYEGRPELLSDRYRKILSGTQYLPERSPGERCSSISHVTATGQLGLCAFLPIIKSCLEKYGVNLWASCSASGSSKVLPVFYINT